MSLRQGSNILAGGVVCDNTPTSGSANAVSSGGVYTALSGKVATGHEVIDFQAPNAGNNYTWYRKYADGWVEQGGIMNAPATVTFPIEMANTYYYGNACPTGNGSSNYSSTVQNRTTTGAEIRFYNESRPTAWEVKGIAA